MSTQDKFEELMKLRESTNKKYEAYLRAMRKEAEAKQEFMQCENKIFNYANRVYVVTAKPSSLDLLEIRECFF